MKTQVTKIERIKEASLPPGVYEGKWGGYEIELAADNGKWRLHTKDGLRGINIRCRVTVTEGGFAAAEVI